MSDPSSDLSSLSPASRATIESFARRIEFWQDTPGPERDGLWDMDDPDRPYIQVASDLVRFTTANCLAATAAHDSEVLVEFKKKLYTEWEMNKITPFKDKPLAELLGQHLVWIDRLFFFGLITQPVRREGKLVAGRPIITLHCGGEIYLPDGRWLHGIFENKKGELHINLWDSRDKYQPFAKAICIVVHELLHVYLGVLVRDDSASRYYHEIFVDKHGAQFWYLLLFMITRLAKWFPTIPYFDELAAEINVDLRAALARPAVSEAVARSLIRFI